MDLTGTVVDVASHHRQIFRIRGDVFALGELKGGCEVPEEFAVDMVLEAGGRKSDRVDERQPEATPCARRSGQA